MIMDFIQRLLPNTKRSSLEKDLENSLKIYEEVSLPMAQTAVDEFKLIDKRSSEFDFAAGQFYSYSGVRQGRPGLFLVDFLTLLENAEKNTRVTLAKLKSALEENTTNDAITLQKAHVIRAAAALAQIADMSASFLVFLLRAQGIYQGADDKFEKEELANFRREHEKLFRFMGSYAGDSKAFEKTMGKIPDAIVTPANFNQVQAMFLKEIDPFAQTEASGFLFHPVLFIREQWADYQIYRYKTNRNLKASFERRVLMLQAQLNNEPTAALEKEISWYENEIEKLSTKIRGFEAKYGG